MGWFCPAQGLSKKAERILQSLADSGSSESAGVADILNTIAGNGDGQQKDDYLVDCAGEIRDAAESFISRMTKKKAAAG